MPSPDAAVCAAQAQGFATDGERCFTRLSWSGEGEGATPHWEVWNHATRSSWEGAILDAATGEWLLSSSLDFGPVPVLD